MSAQDAGHRCQSGFTHLFVAVLGGAAAGAAVAYFTTPRSGIDSRRQLQGLADETRDAVHRVPDALRKATEAARDAFNEALRADS
jgi:gas vesicle protein